MMLDEKLATTDFFLSLEILPNTSTLIMLKTLILKVVMAINSLNVHYNARQ